MRVTTVALGIGVLLVACDPGEDRSSDPIESVAEIESVEQMEWLEDLAELDPAEIDEDTLERLSQRHMQELPAPVDESPDALAVELDPQSYSLGHWCASGGWKEIRYAYDPYGSGYSFGPTQGGCGTFYAPARTLWACTGSWPWGPDLIQKGPWVPQGGGCYHAYY